MIGFFQFSHMFDFSVFLGNNANNFIDLLQCSSGCSRPQLEFRALETTGNPLSPRAAEALSALLVTKKKVLRMGIIRATNETCVSRRWHLLPYPLHGSCLQIIFLVRCTYYHWLLIIISHNIFERYSIVCLRHTFLTCHILFIHLPIDGHLPCFVLGQYE